MTEFINDMLKQIIERENALRAELRKLKEAKAALKAVDGAKVKSKTSQSNNKLSYKDMILGVLKAEGKGLDIDEIMHDVHEIYNVTLERTTVSPTLTRLKNEDEIASFSGKWHSKANLEKNPRYVSIERAFSNINLAEERDIDYDHDQMKEREPFRFKG